MNEGDRTCLLSEYAANVELWKHDDDLRQKRTTAFLTVSTLLLAILTFVIKGTTPELPKSLPILVISVFGLMISIVWSAVHLRNHQYIRFRRRQLIEIEAKLTCIDTFTNQYRSLNQGEEIAFPEVCRKIQKIPSAFKVRWWGQVHSTWLEYFIPGFLGVIWMLGISYAVVLL